MKKIALTGSIGMGKSTVAQMFVDAGIPLFDADAEVRKMQSRGGELVDAIGARFPEAVRDGEVDRDLLATHVLRNRDELAALEMIVHPAVAEKRARFIAANAAAPALLFDIPLLFETGGQAGFDTVIVVSAPADVQRQRVMGRPGMTAARLDSILERQLPDAKKREQADFVIDTNGPLDDTRAQVMRIISCLGLPAAR